MCGCVQVQISHAAWMVDGRGALRRGCSAAFVHSPGEPDPHVSALFDETRSLRVGLADHVIRPVSDSPAGPSGRPRGGMEPRSITAKRSETLDFDVTAPLLTAAVAQLANCKSTTESNSDISLLSLSHVRFHLPDFLYFLRTFRTFVATQPCPVPFPTISASSHLHSACVYRPLLTFEFDAATPPQINASAQPLDLHHNPTSC
jgi:hypothetical protein